MNGNRFDQWAKWLASGIGRRRMLAGAVGVSLAGLLGQREVEARKCQGLREAGHPCGNDKPACCFNSYFGNNEPCIDGRCCPRSVGYSCSGDAFSVFCNVVCDPNDQSQQHLFSDDTSCASAQPCPNGVSDCPPGFICQSNEALTCGCAVGPWCMKACQTPLP
jgi:hypothetical protein